MLNDQLEGRTIRLGIWFALLLGSQKIWPATVGEIFNPYTFLLEAIGAACLAWLVCWLLSMWAFRGKVRRAKGNLANVREELDR